MSNPSTAIMVAPRTGLEPFHVGGASLGFDLASFWRWAASDITSNVWRGVLAEYLVGRALGCNRPVRAEWDACDLKTEGGLRVEVKSAAYLQSWHQRAPSVIEFDIGMKRGWDSETNTSAPSPCRSAGVYVFALLAHREKSSLDPTDLAQWEFYVASARALDARCRSQKRIRLNPLRRIAAGPVAFAELGAAVAAAEASTV